MAAIHELADQLYRLQGELANVQRQLSNMTDQRNVALQELGLYKKLADGVESVMETLNCLCADQFGDERFVRKLKGHFWLLQIDLIQAREGCDEEEALARWVQGRDAKVIETTKQMQAN